MAYTLVRCLFACIICGDKGRYGIALAAIRSDNACRSRHVGGRGQQPMLMRYLNILILFLLACYLSLYFAYYPAPLFSPLFAGNDARQQLFPLYSVIYPRIFENDLIYQAMRGYLAPLHLFISEQITRLTLSPIMTGHWVMMIQLTATVIFLFLTVTRLASVIAACFSVAWLFNSPNLIRNFYGGLPRGWAGVVISSFLYFLVTKNHTAVLIVMFIACLLHPHSAFLVIASYGAFLSLNFIFSKERKPHLKPLVVFIACCPVYFFMTMHVVSRPPEIGKMVSLEEASLMPAFSASGGRFPFLPFDPALAEIRRIGFRVFTTVGGEGAVIPLFALSAVILGYLSAALFQWVRKREIIPRELAVFLLSVIVCYFLARFFAFRLYVPARYLNWPLGLFFIISLPVMLWRIFARSKDGENNSPAAGVVSLFALAAFVFYLSGSGLGGRTNYSPGKHYDSPLYEWVREKTPKDALIAGHPGSLDGLQLYGIRRAYITSETAHPFYDKYNREAERRIEVSFRALLSRSPEEFRQILSAEGITHFVFPKAAFVRRKKDSDRLKGIKYYKPFNLLIDNLISHPADQFIYYRFMTDSRLKETVVFESRDFIVVDLSKLVQEAAERVKSE